MKPHARKLQVLFDDAPFFTSSNNYSTTNTTTPQPSPSSNPVNFDSSMALTVLVLFTALSFIGYLSVYIRRFSTQDQTDQLSSYRRHPPTRKGLDPEIIKALPVYSYCYVEAKYQMECAVCLGEFEDEEIVKLIPHCSHIFHSECIETWLMVNVTCPVCRGTKFSNGGDGGGGLSLGQSTVDEGVGERSRAEDGDTWIEATDVGTSGMCSSVGDRIALPSTRRL
ncbi:hypothetical protein K2173_021131 [Erythroxylum novogranatense]|uniref:RING-type E3 ubiquitin transferase n=1 Tax=Erythroxylum novogranatense TaxID=1862640 RepID=A0AAV8TMP2_9ROSI|nr:hypothetical protein K2173_021131 [Erythroxylum novogranatense]